MYTMTVGDLTFPVAPRDLTVKRKSRNRTVDLLDGSQAVLTRTPSLREYTATLLLPAEEYPFAVYSNGFQSPQYYREKLEEFARAEASVLLVIERDAQREECVVCVEDATFSEDAKHGRDVELKLTLREVETSARYGVYTAPETYTVQDGETLRMIAKRFLGDAELWNYLYGHNIAVLEAAARAHGYADSRFGERLFSGTVLTIPQGVV